MREFLLVIHVLAAIGLVGLVLVQHGKGADMGAAFGSGASQSLFGSRGSANFLSRMTAALATVFFLTSLSLAYLYTGHAANPSVISTESVVKPTQESPAPAVPKGTQPEDATHPNVPSVPK